MRKSRKLILIGILAALPLAVASRWRATADENAITIATWNLEWLVSPATLHAGRIACRKGQRAALPCDVVQDVARDSADFARLAAYARKLDADIVAFQEVEDEATAGRIFAGYHICMADGPGVQHVGFAVRKGLPHRCGLPLDTLALDGRSRKAMSMHWTPQHGPDVELLVVHLKSGCSREPVESDTAACRILDQQSVQLGQWIAARTEERADFIVLGDFNRVPPPSADDVFWQRLETSPATARLADHLPFSNCFAGQPFSAFIDHMLLSSSLLRRVAPSSARHLGFHSADAVRYRMSDHCPVSISLSASGDLRAGA